MSLMLIVGMASGISIKKILAVDDDPVMLKVLSLALAPKGYEVLVAADGPEAFAIVRGQKPDLILLDISFPPDIFQAGNSWDAFLIIEWLQRMDEFQARPIPIIVISGSEPDKFKDRCLVAGAAAYLQKPIRIPELLDAIQQISRTRASDVPVELAAISNSRRQPPVQTSGGKAFIPPVTKAVKEVAGRRHFDSECL